MFGFSRMAHRRIRCDRRSRNCEIPVRRQADLKGCWVRFGGRRTHRTSVRSSIYFSSLWAIWSPKSIKKVPNTFCSYRMLSQTSLVSFSRRVHCAVRASVSFKARAEQCIRRRSGHFELLFWSGTVSVTEKVHDWCHTWIKTSILALTFIY